MGSVLFNNNESSASKINGGICEIVVYLRLYIQVCVAAGVHLNTQSNKDNKKRHRLFLKLYFKLHAIAELKLLLKTQKRSFQDCEKHGVSDYAEDISVLFSDLETT